MNHLKIHLKTIWWMSERGEAKKEKLHMRHAKWNTNESSEKNMITRSIITNLVLEK